MRKGDEYTLPWIFELQKNMEELLNVKTDAFIFKDESVHICGFQLSDNCFRINVKIKIKFTLGN